MTVVTLVAGTGRSRREAWASPYTTQAIYETDSACVRADVSTMRGQTGRALGSDDGTALRSMGAGAKVSVADIGRLKKPVVWTLHDMWAFCGAMQYTDDHRWRGGYLRDNPPGHEWGFDLNRWTWSRKRTHWRQPMHIVTPSTWPADCARESALISGWGGGRS